METKEKKSNYPSQINTKTISCRISSKDYVNFLEDALSKGITLNDWLLMKIYSQSLGKVAEIEEKGGKIENLTKEETESFPISFDSQWGYLTFENESEIIDFIEDCYFKYQEIQKIWYDKVKEIIHKTSISAENLKSNDLLRLSIFSSLKTIAKEIDWETSADKKQVLRDINNLYKDLFKE